MSKKRVNSKSKTMIHQQTQSNIDPESQMLTQPSDSQTKSHETPSFIGGWKEYYQQVESEASGKLGPFEWGVVLVAAAGLMLMYFGSQQQLLFLEFLEKMNWYSEEYFKLSMLAFWVGICVLGYFILPMIYLVLCGRSISNYYLGMSGFWRHLPLYLILFIPVSLLVVWVSYWPEFQTIYPFYTLAGRSFFDLIMWELLYGLQFFALEFFFRAFLLESLRKSIGFGAILLMLLPYCMIHFEKTAAESAGSIVAGVILGMLAMRSRSIWGGVLLHWLVAIEMDVLSLIQKGQFPPL